MDANSLPTDILEHIASFVPVGEINTITQVSKTWHSAAISDTVWQYRVVLPNEHKRSPDKRGVYRGYYIDYKKELWKAEQRHRRMLKLGRFRKNAEYTLGWRYGCMPLAMFICGHIFFLSLATFFILLAIRDPIPALLERYVYIPLWVTLFSLVLFVMYQLIHLATVHKFTDDNMLGAIALALCIYGSIQSVLVFINVGVLPVFPPDDKFIYTRYTISWFLVMIPTYIVVGAGLLGGVIGSIIYLRGESYASFVGKFLRVSTYLLVPTLIGISTILMAANGDYPTQVPVYIEFIPFYILQGAAAIAMIVIVVNMVRGFRLDIVAVGFIMVILLILSLFIVEIMISLEQFARRYLWFSALLPITVMYIIFMMFMFHEGQIHVRCKSYFGWCRRRNLERDLDML